MAFLEAAPCAAVLLNENGEILASNEGFAELAGVDQPLRLRASLTSFVHPDSLANFLRLLRDVREKSKAAQASVVLRRPVAARLIARRMAGARTRIVVLLLDDTARDREAREREREKQTHLDFIDSVEGIVWEMDCETGRTTYLSKEAERLLGYPASDWHCGNEFRERHLFVEDRERALNEFARAVANRENFVVEYRMIAADRRLVWLRDAVTVREVDGRLKLRGVAVDITERKKAERLAAMASEDLEKRVKDRTAELQWTISELESFSYTLSHDMRAPLRSIQGYAQLIAEARGGEASAETNGFLERIMKSARRLDALVQDVLKFGSLAKGNIDLAKVDLDALVRALVEETPELKEPHTTVEIEGTLAPVLAHEGFLTQCLSNLFGNALKFVTPGVKPRIRVRTERRNENEALLWVEDNGIGIAPEDHLRIFKVFERCHTPQEYEGTGIGLAIVQRAAQRMKGAVGVESAVGRGSKFWIQLMAA